MKLKDLLFNREKLRKYDELKEALEDFQESKRRIQYMKRHGIKPIGMSEYVVDIVISALEAEIKKLDEE